jgi:hypothetical protein
MWLHDHVNDGSYRGQIGWSVFQFNNWKQSRTLVEKSIQQTMYISLACNRLLEEKCICMYAMDYFLSSPCLNL